MTLRAWHAVVLVLLSAACVPDEDRSALPPVGENLQAVLAAQCEADGGTWGRPPGGESFVCFRPTRDANRSCRAETDCESFCLARSRTCAPVTPFFGCHEVLSSQGVRSTVCIE